MRRVVVTMPVIIAISSLACVVIAQQGFELRSTITSQDPQVGAFFGWSVALSSDSFVVRDTEVARGDASDAGQVYVYDSGTLALEAVFSSPNPREGAGFGSAVAVGSGKIVIGEAWATVNNRQNAGQVYVYGAKNLDLEVILASPDPQADAVFGYSVAVGSGLVVVGEPKADVGDVRMAGRVHVYGETSVGGAASAQEGTDVLAISCLFLSSMAVLLILVTRRGRIAEFLRNRKA
jgi:hypothetical protein